MKITRKQLRQIINEHMQINEWIGCGGDIDDWDDDDCPTWFTDFTYIEPGEMDLSWSDWNSTFPDGRSWGDSKEMFQISKYYIRKMNMLDNSINWDTASDADIASLERKMERLYNRTLLRWEAAEKKHFMSPEYKAYEAKQKATQRRIDRREQKDDRFFGLSGKLRKWKKNRSNRKLQKVVDKAMDIDVAELK